MCMAPTRYTAIEVSAQPLVLTFVPLDTVYVTVVGANHCNINFVFLSKTRWQNIRCLCLKYRRKTFLQQRNINSGAENKINFDHITEV